MDMSVDRAVPVACWSCSAEHHGPALSCAHCGKIQPPSGGNYFSVLGLVPRLNLDLQALEIEFHRLSRKLHPDRFARAPGNEREWSLAHTALLNDAYRTLKDPIARTEYLLKLHGAVVDQHSAGAHPGRMSASRVPPDLLEEVFELNMQLEEMRRAHTLGKEEDPALKQSLSEVRKKFQVLRDEVDSDLRAQWNAWDSGDSSARPDAQQKMIALLDRRRYLSNLVRDVTDTLDGSDGARIFSKRGR